MSEIKKVPKRGISTYCFYPMMDVNMELEDIFMHMEDMGAPGLEILADGIIEGYPHPSNKWLDKWFSGGEIPYRARRIWSLGGVSPCTRP